jgi:hypothetical protein
MEIAMKRILIALCLTPLFWSGASVAQDQEAPNLTAIEMFTCNYNKGKGSKDLDRVIDKWNAWADKENFIPYNAWTLTPMFGSADYSFDVGWLGAWKDGAGMGKGLQQWKNEGGAMQAEFDKVLTCDAHFSYTSANFKPQQGDWPAKGLTVFTDCTVAEGKALEDSIAAHGKWAKHLTDSGSKAGMWAFYPMFGGGDENYDYKIVMAHPDYVSLGNDHNNYTNGEGWKVGREMSQGVVSCNTPRVYDSVLRRNGGVKGD